MRSVALALFLVACGGSKAAPVAPSTTMNASDGPTCDAMSSHMLDTLSQGKPVPPDEMKKMHDMFQSHCERDAWAPEARRCFNDMKTMEDGNKCADSLTQAQKDAMDKEMGAQQPATGSPAVGGAPPPGGAAEGGSRGAHTKGGDPQDGGE
ncbi:MAG: hypothetical protein QM831_16805 [Kofleriaceae bacterium]